MSTRKWTTFAAATLLATALMTRPAAAAPTDCSYQVDDVSYEASSYCSSGTGEHRIRVVQSGGRESVGPWAPAGSISFTNISAFRVIDAWVETRG
ncbi:hypothetical protein Skr01_56970 [Sphaerisporangium krabiense]|uniref:Streptomyces killer toxin-like beta/gamma crystallin domain-containing protein n=1 Tax=Sphaerisporangium krabiense TaxID=763782 RepID=A0A7W8Z8P1_9ACTN|nr:hypothetical protein [Sphaerisporangium krabiense]MBB5629534.1 hypothetical protein [Sphaerisporangium krabiense]GII65612.1 hypothetical protein Skr01_56970 [Sphaerisporangium krabiense]